VRVRRRGAALRLASPNPIPAQTPRESAAFCVVRVRFIRSTAAVDLCRLGFPLNAPRPAGSRIAVSGAPPLADCPLANVGQEL